MLVVAQLCTSIPDHQKHWALGHPRVAESSMLTVLIKWVGALVPVMVAMQRHIHSMLYQKLCESLFQVISDRDVPVVFLVVGGIDVHWTMPCTHTCLS